MSLSALGGGETAERQLLGKQEMHEDIKDVEVYFSQSRSQGCIGAAHCSVFIKSFK